VRPITIEGAVGVLGGILWAARLGPRESRFEGVEIAGHKRPGAASLLCSLAVACVRHEVLHGAEEIGAKAPPIWGGTDEPTGFDNAGQEGLGEVLGLVGRSASAAGKGVEGAPIGRAEMFEGGAGLGLVAVLGAPREGGDEAPLRGVEAGWATVIHGGVYRQVSLRRDSARYTASLQFLVTPFQMRGFMLETYVRNQGS
jgi:hypothetical protein